MRRSRVPGPIATAAAVLSLAALCPAAALPMPPRPGQGAVHVLLVCDAGGCRHRFTAYRARPNWNGYWARQAQDRRDVERRPASPPARR